MFEFEQYDPAAAGALTHPVLPPEVRQTYHRKRIRSYSVMNWGEHCTECAFPSCYQTCSFYQPRQDGRCRRFEFGICRAPSPDSWMGYSALVEFRNWSMFWAQGNATQLPRVLSGLTQAFGAMVWGLSGPVDALLHKTTGRKRLSPVLQALRRRFLKGVGQLYPYFPKPDCLLLEVFNPMEEPMRLYLSVGQSKRQFELTRQVPPGFSSFAIPREEIERWVDFGKEFKLKLMVAEEEHKRLYVCSATFVRLNRAPAPAAAPASGKKIKCVIWDLDNTLWDGVLVERGEALPVLKDGILSVLRELDRRGILLSIASKNSEADARQVLEQLGIWDLFLAPQINWGPKSASIQRIAEQLNLGLDAFAFVDDMPFERDEVASVLPTVTLVPAETFLSLLGQPAFAGDASGEGSNRRLTYRTESERKEAYSASNLDYDAFLATCGIRVSIQRPNAELLPRVYDIVQRTNQLNIASQRYEMHELEALTAREDIHCFVVSCSDNYGEYGHVGFIVVALEGPEVRIRDCMFSCRIQGKRIDEAILLHLLNAYLRRGATSLRARYVATKRNTPAREMLERLGFVADPAEKEVLFHPAPAVRDELPHVCIESQLSDIGLS